MKAMILAAGLGTRMRPLTLKTPKPMLKVANKPLIEHQVMKLVDAGFTDIVINHAYLGEQIEAYLQTGKQWGCNIQYSAEPSPLETAGGILKALPMLTTSTMDSFLVVNGDIWSDIDYRQCTPLPASEQANLMLVDNPSHHASGDFLLQAGKVFEPTASGARSPTLTFSGVSVLKAELFDECDPSKDGGVYKLAPLLKSAMSKGKVSGQHHTGYWLDVGTPERLTELDAYLSKPSMATE